MAWKKLQDHDSGNLDFNPGGGGIIAIHGLLNAGHIMQITSNPLPTVPLCKGGNGQFASCRLGFVYCDNLQPRIPLLPDEVAKKIIFKIP